MDLIIPSVVLPVAGLGWPASEPHLLRSATRGWYRTSVKTSQEKFCRPSEGFRSLQALQGFRLRGHGWRRHSRRSLFLAMTVAQWGHSYLGTFSPCFWAIWIFMVPLWVNRV